MNIKKLLSSAVNPSGLGYADYVLWRDDGLPFAVIEAKKTMANPKQGKHQAELDADCLQEMHGQRPVIFYSNGFENYLWDDQFYPEREVQGFYNEDGSSHFCDEPVFSDADADADADATKVIKLIDRVNDNALVIRAA